MMFVATFFALLDVFGQKFVDLLSCVVTGDAVQLVDELRIPRQDCVAKTLAE